MLPGKTLGALVATLAVFAAGFGIAWDWRGGDVAKAEAETIQVRADFAAYVAEGIRLINEATIVAAQQREAADHDWKKTVERLKTDRLAFDRCVAAGRCGPFQRVCPATPSTPSDAGGQAPAIPPAGQSDGAGTDAIHPSSGLAADCERTTAQLNALQSDIERQPGY